MKDLREIMEGCSLASVKTYIQSGNAVFQVDDCEPAFVSQAIEDEVKQRFGFRPRVFILPVEDLKDLLAGNPFDVESSLENTVHLFLLHEPTFKIDLAMLEALASGTEKVTLTDRALYLHAPNGIGKSKLIRNFEKFAGVPTTARNLRTIKKLIELSPT